MGGRLIARAIKSRRFSSKEKNFLEAVNQYRECIKLDPQFVYGYKNLGSLMFITGSIDKAIINYNKAMRLDPHQADLLDYLGLAYFQKGNVPKAIECFEKAIQENPDFNEAIMHLNQAKGARNKTY